MSVQRGEVDQKIFLEQLKQEHESYASELKMQLQSQQRTLTDLQLDSEQTKESLERKTVEFRDLRGKVDAIVAEKVKFESESKKLGDKLEKALEKEAK